MRHSLAGAVVVFLLAASHDEMRVLRMRHACMSPAVLHCACKCSAAAVVEPQHPPRHAIGSHSSAAAMALLGGCVVERCCVSAMHVNACCTVSPRMLAGCMRCGVQRANDELHWLAWFMQSLDVAYRFLRLVCSVRHTGLATACWSDNKSFPQQLPPPASGLQKSKIVQLIMISGEVCSTDCSGCAPPEL
jgi:hypothetical protein